jgi:predicted O-methyltransferase YrrM
MTMRRHRLTPLLAVVLTLASLTAAGAQSAATKKAPKAPDVPYVPTHQDIVQEMLVMARVRPDDVLYDLGSGDGRIVIAAARQFGTRGVGYDIDPQRVREANVNARRAGVTDKVKFVHGDIFEADIKEATVVTLYLLPDVNLRLRPKLLSELRPGTRVVSHNYDMGDWVPEKSKRMEVQGADHFVYFWTIPPRAVTR